MAVILVGAIFVGCMDTVWHGTVTPPHRGTIGHINYDEADAPSLEKGIEMGRFNMGSTVIVLWPDQTMTWDKNFVNGTTVKMGQTISLKS